MNKRAEEYNDDQKKVKKVIDRELEALMKSNESVDDKIDEIANILNLQGNGRDEFIESMKMYFKKIDDYNKKIQKKLNDKQTGDLVKKLSAECDKKDLYNTVRKGFKSLNLELDTMSEQDVLDMLKKLCSRPTWDQTFANYVYDRKSIDRYYEKGIAIPMLASILFGPIALLVGCAIALIYIYTIFTGTTGKEYFGQLDGYLKRRIKKGKNALNELNKISHNLLETIDEMRRKIDRILDNKAEKTALHLPEKRKTYETEIKGFKAMISEFIDDLKNVGKLYATAEGRDYRSYLPRQTETAPGEEKWHGLKKNKKTTSLGKAKQSWAITLCNIEYKYRPESTRKVKSKINLDLDEKVYVSDPELEGLI